MLEVILFPQVFLENISFIGSFKNIHILSDLFKLQDKNFIMSYDTKNNDPHENLSLHTHKLVQKMLKYYQRHRTRYNNIRSYFSTSYSLTYNHRDDGYVYVIV